MNNDTDDIISNKNDVPTVVFTKWPLDMDDDEFRAGYPFTSVPLGEMNEQETWYDASSTCDDDDASQSVNSQNNDLNKTTKGDEESSHFLFNGQEEFMECDGKSCAVHHGDEDYDENQNQNQNHEEYERNSYDQHISEQTDNLNDTKINRTHSAK